MKLRPLHLAVLAASLASATPAWSQSQPSAPSLDARIINVAIDSGLVSAPAGASSQPDPHGLVVVYATEVRAAGSAWIRLFFDHLTLAGPSGTEKAAYLKIISPRDGATQQLSTQAAIDWNFSSAFFNGDAVRIELWAAPDAGASRLAISKVLASAGDLLGVQDICGLDDDRAQSGDVRVARLIAGTNPNFPVICSSWVFNDTNHFFLAAGHCAPAGSSVVEFNIPPSNSSAQIQHPPPQDQYAVDGLSVQRSTSGVGNDWSYFGVFANANTGLMPFQVYGGSFQLANTITTPPGQIVRITGNGSVTFPVPPESNYAQQTHSGAFVSVGSTLRYQVDTSSGNSGSPVIDESSGLAIGIHFLAGCGPGGGGGNQAVPITNTNLRAAIAAPFGIARTGLGTPAGSIFAIGDAANNFGTVNGPPNRFAKVAQIGARWQGLAWNPLTQHFFACDSALQLHTVDATGSSTLLGTITGSGGAILSGLGFDPRRSILYGIAAATGRLYSIDPSTLVATPIGIAPITPGSVSGLDFDTRRDRLVGLDDQPTGTRLVSINTSTGQRTVIGPLGNSVSDCNGLGFSFLDDAFYTINAVDDFLYRVDPVSGASVRVGFTFGAFGTSFGMACINAAPCAPDFNQDAFLNPDDLADFIGGFFSQPTSPQCDFNLDGEINPDDLADFIAAYFAGCP